jgi:CRP-like cAMP-binding protein
VIVSGKGNSALSPALRKLQLWEVFSQADAEALLGLPHQVRTLRAHQYFVREQEKPRHCCLLIDGYAIRHKTTGRGDRQIFSIHLPGDFIDLHNSLLRSADHSIEALTAATAAFIPVEAVKEIAFSRPAVGQAMWYETLVDGSIFREWTLNVGRRDAQTRTAHLLCEFSVRMQLAGLGDHNGYELPMTQSQLADALGLTAVHVNRTIKSLREGGLVEFDRRAVKILDFQGLARLGDFDSGYLHLPQGNDDGPRPPAL